MTTELHNLIKQDAHALAETNIERLQRYVQKLANAAQLSFAERAFLQDQTRFPVQNEQRSQSSPIDQVSGSREGKRDEL